MYSLVRRYLKTAIAFLALGLVIGSWMIARRELYGAAPNPYLVSAHTHALFVGFVMLMIMGVALWLFPRPAKEDERYSPGLAAAAYWVTTIATAARRRRARARTDDWEPHREWRAALAALGNRPCRHRAGGGDRYVLLYDVDSHPSGRQSAARSPRRTILTRCWYQIRPDVIVSCRL